MEHLIKGEKQEIRPLIEKYIEKSTTYIIQMIKNNRGKDQK